MISDTDPDVAGGQSVTDDGGPPLGYAWTLEVAGEEGWSADLEHAAPIPRIGETLEYIAEDGTHAFYRVTDVMHTVQPAASERPTVREEHSTPNSLVTDGVEPGPPRELRAGLPRVVVAAIDADGD
jgi:hypothetical protein